MPIKVAINGFGRIGRPVLRIGLEHKNLEFVAINDLVDSKTLANLFTYDSVYGTYAKEVQAKDHALIIDGKEIKVLSEKDPSKLPWKELGVDIVIESTGFFKERKTCKAHLDAGAKSVIISTNTKSPEEVNTYVLGVNTDKYDSAIDDITAMASCTTNCLSPIAQVLNDEFGIIAGLMTTVHSYTSTQNLVDGPHDDLRRARNAALSIIPTDTGAALAIARVLPELEGKLDGRAFRVPTPTVSIVDLVCRVEKEASVESINEAFIKAAEGRLRGVLAVEHHELVSQDFKQNPHASIVDLPLTMVGSGNLIKVFSWYDNEWGYCNRLIEYTDFIASNM